MKPSLKKDASFRSIRYREVLGVDLGSHSVKLLQVRVTGDKAAIVAFAQKEVWPQLAEAASDDERRAIYAQALRELYKSQRFKAKGAAFAVSGSASIVRFLRLAKPFKTDPKTGIPEKALVASPFEPDDTTIEVRFTDQDKAYADATAVIAQKKAINGAISILRKGRLRPSVILNDALALELGFEFQHAEASEEPVVLVNLGAATTGVSIIEKRALRAARTFNIAGDVFTRAIKRELGGSTAEAESFKKEYGLFGRRVSAGKQPAAQSEAVRIYNETAVRVAKALEPSVEDLVAGIVHTIEAFADKRPKGAPPIRRLVLSGGGAELKGFEEILSLETGLMVSIFDGVPSPAAAVVYGLALTGAVRGRSGPRVNLLPPEAKRAAAARNAGRLVMIAAALVGLVLGGQALLDWQHRRAAAREIEIERVLKEPRPEPPAAPAKPAPKPKPVSPYAYLGRMRATGSFGDVVMLQGPGGEFVVKAGRLFDPQGQAVANVSVSLKGKTLVLSAPGESHVVAVPE